MKLTFRMAEKNSTTAWPHIYIYIYYFLIGLLKMDTLNAVLLVLCSSTILRNRFVVC